MNEYNAFIVISIVTYLVECAIGHYENQNSLIMGRWMFFLLNIIENHMLPWTLSMAD